ncbi:histidine triad (HIT) protein [Lentzea tibetensis]|uniref:Histidine triad (HIT) protein n=1 Tax=Lentzea tibetensis TaxID=2591470 RepID=A0A563EQC1_9PSEU|nr:histidine triad (HIT) protein [Lentzea tibetensis]TWP49596.1 histidine triad (HIT) protein [Lentzea tibetensis]
MGCLICAKHRGAGELAGPVVWRDSLVVVSHRLGGFPGYLFVETVRHVPFFDGLSGDEVVAVARAVHTAGRALRAELSPLFVFSLIAGRGVAHFHQHVFVRHPGTPEEVDWTWTEAPVVSEPEIDALCERLRGHFSG